MYVRNLAIAAEEAIEGLLAELGRITASCCGRYEFNLYPRLGVPDEVLEPGDATDKASLDPVERIEPWFDWVLFEGLDQ